MKILRSKKALSPVVASIILIAVTVAVSLAVGGYMFGLFDVFKGENVKITNVNFVSSPKGTTITFQNLGTASVSIKYIQVNNGSSTGWTQIWTASGTNGDIEGNAQLAINFAYNWAAGTSYDFRAVTSKGTTLSQTQVAS
jgi:flagellin-like protein